MSSLILGSIMGLLGIALIALGVRELSPGITIVGIFLAYLGIARVIVYWED